MADTTRGIPYENYGAVAQDIRAGVTPPQGQPAPREPMQFFGTGELQAQTATTRQVINNAGRARRNTLTFGAQYHADDAVTQVPPEWATPHMANVIHDEMIPEPRQTTLMEQHASMMISAFARLLFKKGIIDIGAYQRIADIDGRNYVEVISRLIEVSDEVTGINPEIAVTDTAHGWVEADTADACPPVPLTGR